MFWLIENRLEFYYINYVLADIVLNVSLTKRNYQCTLNGKRT